jgi:hypothetical protein
MRKQSERYPRVFYECWKTPTRGTEYIYFNLIGVLQTSKQTHFFFSLNERKGEEKLVVTVPEVCAYQLVDEGTGISYDRKYSMPKGPYKPYKKGRGRPTKPCHTWKFWNTDFLQELRESPTFYLREKKRKKQVCEYMIMAANDWITFVTFHRPSWKFHHNIKIEKLMKQYMEGDS